MLTNLDGSADVVELIRFAIKEVFKQTSVFKLVAFL